MSENNDFSNISLSHYLSTHPGTKELVQALPNSHSRTNDDRVRELFYQALAQHWFPPERINYEQKVELDEPVRQAWIRLNLVFYTLEKMGLSVIQNMMPKAVKYFGSNEVANYLSAQCYDEARHVMVIENFLRRLGSPPKYNRIYHKLGQLASLGAYRVENWLFSTLFSENFASAFLRSMRTATIDPTGVAMAKSLLQDEARHVRFLEAVLPSIVERLGLLGRTYVKVSQSFIVTLSERMSRSLEKESKVVGLNKDKLFEEVFSNLEVGYETVGLSRKFLKLPTLKTAVPVGI